MLQHIHLLLRKLQSSKTWEIYLDKEFYLHIINITFEFNE